MKKIYNLLTIFLMVAFLFSATSCEDLLEEEPVSEILTEKAITDTEGLQTAIIGCYDKLQSSYLYGGRIWVGGDMLAGNVKKSGEYALVFEEIQMMQQSMSPDNLITASLWQDAYWTINMANLILKTIPEVEASEDPDIASNKNTIEGEAKFIRAMLYFDLVRYIGNLNNGLGVPLLTEPTGIDAQPPRATIEEVYTQVISDLETASEILPESNSDRATKWAAKALLSRVYFYHKDYQKSAEAATEVIDSEKFILADSVQFNYTETLTDEIIFALMSAENDYSVGTLNGYYREASTPRFSPSNDMLRLFLFTGGLDDQRYTEFFHKTEGGKLFITKFDSRYMNVPLIRLAELYITRCECIFNGASIPGVSALSDLNETRRRAGLTAETSINATKIYYERTKELAYEGDNFHNLKRLERDISGLEFNNRRLLYPIPQREIDVNPNLQQN